MQNQYNENRHPSNWNAISDGNRPMQQAYPSFTANGLPQGFAQPVMLQCDVQGYPSLIVPGEFDEMSEWYMQEYLNVTDQIDLPAYQLVLDGNSQSIIPGISGYSLQFQENKQFSNDATHQVASSTFSSASHLKYHVDTQNRFHPYAMSGKTSNTSTEMKKGEAQCCTETAKTTKSHRYLCNTCGKEYQRKSSLVSHNKSHTNPLSLECSFCSRKFDDLSTLVKHRRTHTGERPYKCGQCGKSFAQSGNLRRHQRTCH